MIYSIYFLFMYRIKIAHQIGVQRKKMVRGDLTRYVFTKIHFNSK